MQQDGKTSPPDVDTYSPNIDHGAGPLEDQDSDKKPSNDQVPPTEPQPVPVEEPGPAKPAIDEDTDEVRRIVDAY